MIAVGLDGSGAGAPTVLELSGETTPVSTLVADLWRRRDLIVMLAQKEFHSRYRSATFGVLWSVFLPLIQGGVMAVVFTRIVKIGLSGGDSYPVYVIVGTVVWSYFAASLTTGSTSIVDQGAIAGKVYFPRLVLSAVPAVANLVGFVISVLVALALMPFFGVAFRIQLVFLPLSMILFMILAVAISAICSVAHVYFRDVRYIVQAALMVLFYATPVIYPLDRPHGLLRALVAANPATGPVQLAHYAVFGHAASLGPSLVATAVGLTILVVASLVAYRRFERVACDRL